MSGASFILGTAGHIDHGKSTLIQTLTGTDPDRLAEEKRRGITIELGFAQLVLPDGTEVGVVDVPGHERFVRQMIAGATGIDVALLCIAADDGIMPQTVEHVHVLELLGIRQAVVALTKTDLVDSEWTAFMADEVRGFLAGTPYADAPIIPVSAKEGIGLDALREAIAQAATHAARLHGGEEEPARLPIDRAFTIKGAGTVVTGTLWSGCIHPDDELELLPAGKRVRVRNVQEHNRPVDIAFAGSRTALNLASIGTDEAQPGMMLTTPDLLSPTDRFDAWLSYLGPQDNARPLESGANVRVAHGTAEVMGRILLMDGRANIEIGGQGFCQIRLDAKLPLIHGDRFVIRSLSPVEVVGGGIALLPHPRRRTNLAPAEHALLESLRDKAYAAALDAAMDLQNEPESAEKLVRNYGIPLSDSVELLRSAVKSGKLLKLESGRASCPLYAPPRLLQSLTGRLESALMKFHAQNPNRTGATKAELMKLTGIHMPELSFEGVLSYACEHGKICRDGAEISHTQAGAGAKAQLRQAAATLKEKIDAAGMAPPAFAALAKACDLDQQLAYRALGTLETTGEAVRIGEFAFSSEAVQSAKQRIAACIKANGQASASQLKDALELSRKHAIPLLEYLDAQGFTRRDGDTRVLNG